MTSEHPTATTGSPLWRRVAHGLGFPSRTESTPHGSAPLGWPPAQAAPTETTGGGTGPEGASESSSPEGAPEDGSLPISPELSTRVGTVEGHPGDDDTADVSRETAVSSEVLDRGGENETPQTEHRENVMPGVAVDAAAMFVDTQAEAHAHPTEPAETRTVSRETSLALEDTPLMRAVVRETRQKQELDSRRLPRPDRTRILTVANQKGGVGKTTTTVNTAAALALAGLSVLVVDLDPQGNASTALGVPHHSEVTSIYDVLVDGTPLADIVQTCPDVDGLLCAPATIDLAGSEIELVSLVARETRLRRALSLYLSEREERIDYVLIDCPPSLGLLTVNAFVAADEVFIPIQCEYYALEGLSQLLKNIELIRTHLNPDLHVSTILLTMYDARTRLSAQVADEVRTHFGAQTLRSTVPRSVRVSEAPSHGQTVITYDPMSTGALAYRQAAAEIADRGVGSSPDDATRDAENDGLAQDDRT